MCNVCLVGVARLTCDESITYLNVNLDFTPILTLSVIPISSGDIHVWSVLSEKHIGLKICDTNLLLPRQMLFRLMLNRSLRTSSPLAAKRKRKSPEAS